MQPRGLRGSGRSWSPPGLRECTQTKPFPTARFLRRFQEKERLRRNKGRLLEVGVLDAEKKLGRNEDNSVVRNVKLTLWSRLVVGHKTPERRVSEELRKPV